MRPPGTLQPQLVFPQPRKSLEWLFCFIHAHQDKARKTVKWMVVPYIRLRPDPSRPIWIERRPHRPVPNSDAVTDRLASTCPPDQPLDRPDPATVFLARPLSATQCGSIAFPPSFLCVFRLGPTFLPLDSTLVPQSFSLSFRPAGPFQVKLILSGINQSQHRFRSCFQSVIKFWPPSMLFLSPDLFLSSELLVVALGPLNLQRYDIP